MKWKQKIMFVIIENDTIKHGIRKYRMVSDTLQLSMQRNLQIHPRQLRGACNLITISFLNWLVLWHQKCRQNFRESFAKILALKIECFRNFATIFSRFRRKL